MKAEYDFTNAERGKFFRPDAVLKLPVFLDEDVRSSLSARARDRGVELDRLVNDILKKDIALSKTAR